MNLQARWLLVRYRLDSAKSVPIGIVLYLPATETLHFRFRTTFDFVRPDDREIVAEAGKTFEQLAIELGAAKTFAWMESSLSNVVFVEGPFAITMDARVEENLAELYRRHIAE